MTADPRLAVAMRWANIDEWSAKRLLTELDAVDPLRKPVSQDRVEAALDAYAHYWRNWPPSAQDECRADMAKALAAADRVPVRKESLPNDFPPWSREMAALVRELGKFWVRETTDGEVYDRRHAQFLAAFLETPGA